jgi:hypothetical protein
MPRLETRGQRTPAALVAGVVSLALVHCKSGTDDPPGAPYYVTPTILGTGGGVLDSGSVRHGDVKLVGELTNPTGLALDEAGNLFFGEVLSGPVRVILRKRTPDGTITELGTVVDTSAGYVSGSWTFSVAVSPAGEVV